MYRCVLLICTLFTPYSYVSEGGSFETSTYVPPSVWETKFHTHIKQQEKIMVMYIFIVMLAEISPLTNGDPIMKLNVPLGLSMKLHLPLSLSLLQYLFMWMKLHISRGLLWKYIQILVSQVKLRVPHGLKVKHKYPLFHTSFQCRYHFCLQTA